MFQNWTFGRRIAVSYGIAGLLLLLVWLFSLGGSIRLNQTEREVMHVTNQRFLLHEVYVHVLEGEGNIRAYMIQPDERFISLFDKAEIDYRKALNALKPYVAHEADMSRRFAELQSLCDKKWNHMRENSIMLKQHAFNPLRVRGGTDLMQEIDQRINALYALESDVLAKNEKASSHAHALMLFGNVAALALGITLLATMGLTLTRTLTCQVGTAVSRLESSSSELSASASQQATTATQQSSSMSELAITTKEVLAAARQVSESAQLVATVAKEADSASQAGAEAVERAQASQEILRTRVETIVTHMVDLGKKSQQIGNVLDIIKELAEQTNILAINATIEAAGAGVEGRRFSAVAEEIRKLADRVGGSTRSIRPMVEEIRASANTAVMTTEEGFKAVEAANKQFTGLKSAFSSIEFMVSRVSHAAREIELSTKQQASAVEQVNLSIAELAQAGKEAEANTRMTALTSTELAMVSRSLSSFVKPAK